MSDPCELTISKQTRFRAVTKKIARAITGLNGSLFVHVEFDGRDKACKVKFSWKGKDGSDMDHIMVALGDATTEVLRLGPMEPDGKDAGDNDLNQ